MSAVGTLGLDIFTYENGLGNVYHSGTDYLPLFHYVLKLFGSLREGSEDIIANIHHLKLWILPFHFITAFFIALMIKKKDETSEKQVYHALLYVLNAAVLYNTIIWGQVDEILTCLILIATFYAYEQRVTLSLVFLLLAINFKLQAIVFLPVLGLLLLPVVIKTFSFKRLTLWIVIPVAIQLCILLPFISTGTIPNLMNVITGSVGKYPVVSLNAYNIWDFLIKGDLLNTADDTIYRGLSYKSWGLLMFFSTSALALFPLLKRGYTALVKRQDFFVPLEKLLLICALIPLLFFYFNTQMHERYSHPAIAFLTAYSIYTGRYFITVLGSVAYFLNLERVLHFLQLHNYETVIFDRMFISGLYLLLIILLFIFLYKRETQIKENPLSKRLLMGFTFKTSNLN